MVGSREVSSVGAARWLGLGVAGLIGFFAIAYDVLKLAPDLFAETNGLDATRRADARQGVRTASLALLAGAIGVISAVYTARSFGLNRAGQLTDRFTKAIDQLGHESLDVRLGGIYALERIARDSKEDHPQVVEVLTAYVREHAPRRDTLPSPAEGQQHQEAVVRSADVPPVPAIERPATDVQAALTVLARRTLAHEQGATLTLELSFTDLRGANLAGANLPGALLIGADLRRANLTAANLSEAHLGGANLIDASLGGAHLGGARLPRAAVRGAYLGGATLRGANLAMANLHGASLTKADLAGATLNSTSLGKVRYDVDTTWPPSFDPEAAGACLERGD